MSAEKRFTKKTGLLGYSQEDVDAAGRKLPSFDFSASSLHLGKPMLVELGLIEASPYQTSELSEEKIAELVENLRNNQLSSPIVVRRRTDGALEIIAGRHRREAYRRLGRSEIEASLRDLTDDEAERLVFFDNLLAPSLTDYQKYLGFSQRKRSKVFTNDQLAQEAGVNPSVISKLMSFEGLPDSVHAVLKEHHSAVGSSFAPALVEHAVADPALAIKAIHRIVAGEMTQKAALDWLKAGGEEKPLSSVETHRAMIRSGKKKYAELSLRQKRMIINLADESEATVVYSAIEKLLKELGAAAK